jgi:CubicO group peptidase (beta-lactamase class C family)
MNQSKKLVRLPFFGSGNLYGLWSTVSDLSHFLIALINGGVYKEKRILKEESIILMHNRSSIPNVLLDRYSGYGLGSYIYNNSIYGINSSGHDNHGIGYMGTMRIDLDLKIGVILLWNTNYNKFQHGASIDNVAGPIEKEILKKAIELTHR